MTTTTSQLDRDTTCTLLAPAATMPEPAASYPLALFHLSGRPFIWTAFAPPHSAAYRWAWVQETVAAEFGVGSDEVDCVEHEDVGEIVTVRGEPVLILRSGRGATRAPPLAADLC